MDGDHYLELSSNNEQLHVLFDDQLIDQITAPDEYFDKKSYITAALRDWERIAKNLDMRCVHNKLEEDNNLIEPIVVADNEWVRGHAEGLPDPKKRVSVDLVEAVPMSGVDNDEDEQDDVSGMSM